MRTHKKKIRVPVGNLRGCGLVGLSVDQQSHSVVEMHEKGLTYLSAKIGLDFTLVTIGSETVSSATLSVLDRELSSGEKLELTFRRPAPPLPLHGIARKGIHKSVQYVLHKKQLEWLETNVFAGGRTLQRDKSAAEAMKAFFHSTMREDTMTPMWLDEERISSWLSARVREEKDRRKSAKYVAKVAKSTSASAAAASASTTASKKRARPGDSTDESDNGSAPGDGGSSSSESDSEVE